MQLNSDFRALSSTPEWLVSNGTVTVGPVGTELLLRGVMHGKVPSTSWVRQTGWPSWREVGKIREVSALHRVLERNVEQLEPSTLRESAEALFQAHDAGEALLIALHAAARATSATVGLAHRLREPLFLPTTTCAFGAASERLGEVLPWFDPAFAFARTGYSRLLSGSGSAGSLEHASSTRLSPSEPLQGLALLPIWVSGRLYAFFELGRSDHPFRDSDAMGLSEFGGQVAASLSRFGAVPGPRCS